MIRGGKHALFSLKGFLCREGMQTSISVWKRRRSCSTSACVMKRRVGVIEERIETLEAEVLCDG